jgi:hypothetical protein
MFFSCKENHKMGEKNERRLIKTVEFVIFDRDARRQENWSGLKLAWAGMVSECNPAKVETEINLLYRYQLS